MINLSELLRTLYLAHAGLKCSLNTLEAGLGVSIEGSYDVMRVAIEAVEGQIETIIALIEGDNLEGTPAND